MSKTKGTFEITAYDGNGIRRPYGGDKFAVCVRGASYVYAKVIDNNDGKYTVEYKPSTSGSYTIAITLAGRSMPGSPFALTVLVPRADASRCTLRGDALKNIVARNVSTFEVEFCDAFSQVAHAEELDVYVEPRPDPTIEDDNISLWKVLVWAVVVSPKSLYVRETRDLSSKRVTELGPGTLVGVVETVDVGNGSRRARIIFNRGASRAGATANMDETPSISPTRFTPRTSPFTTPSTTPRIDPNSHLARSISPGRSPRGLSPGRSPRAGSLGRSPRTQVRLSLPLGGGVHSAEISGAVTDRPRSAPLTGRSFMPGALSARELSEVGWVTAAKDGQETLVLRHQKLDASRRQDQMRRWNKQVAMEANRKAAEARAQSGTAEQMRAARAGPSCAHELVADKTGIGFAYGGVDPGTLHAHGRLVKTHTVSYSIGKSGRYLLFVGLRNQKVAMPGSPFELTVEPGSAHPAATSLPSEMLPLCGVVGELGCVKFVTRDRMGNLCVVGEAPARVDAKTDKLRTSYVDNSDGSYDMQWLGEVSGKYDVHVTIDGMHVSGSPTELTLLPAKPEVPKCEVSGGGLNKAVAGDPVVVSVRCKDRFSNPTLPGSSLSFGLAIAPPATVPEKSEKKDKKGDKSSKAELTAGDSEKVEKGEKSEEACQLPSMEFDGIWKEEGEYLINYIAEKAGDFELHLWCDTDGDGTRQKLPASPFSLHVTAAKASPSGSRLIGADQVRNMPLTAGDRLELGIQLRDPFGNPCAAPERSRGGQRAQMAVAKSDEDDDDDGMGTMRSSLRRSCSTGRGRPLSGAGGGIGGKEKIIVVTGSHDVHQQEGVTSMLVCFANDGRDEQPLTDKLRPGDQLGTFSLAYELHVAATYECHLMLNGQEINGSPVNFKVKPAAPSGRLSTLQIPDYPPTVHEEYELLLIAEDKFGNRLDRGGANVQARALGPSASPATTKDYNNGTYGIKFTAGAVGEYRVEVRLDNVKIKGSPHQVNFTGSVGSKRCDDGQRPPVGAPSTAELAETDATSSGEQNSHTERSESPLRGRQGLSQPVK